jgi:hypothetical protein
MFGLKREKVIEDGGTPVMRSNMNFALYHLL